ncbi:hypothetical protein [Streptomyces syringium]|uniref:hypothetical protein n=1 Tax=Streptomyces syringium TaxID=76729 RepID=UPI00343B8C93
MITSLVRRDLVKIAPHVGRLVELLITDPDTDHPAHDLAVGSEPLGTLRGRRVLRHQ